MTTTPTASSAPFPALMAGKSASRMKPILSVKSVSVP
ncbi:MAG: hypothetical protein E6Q75_07080 [Rheinheimera sp.]|nr:MAG: hypothetical protein E6Q75_07080 [Rheinheimera sp.]